MHQTSNLYRWFVHNLLLSRPAVNKPKPSKPSSGSGLAVSGMRSVFSGAVALAVMVALGVAVGGSATAGVLAVAVGVLSVTAGAAVVAAGVGSDAAEVLAVAAGVLSVTVGESAVASGAGSATAGVLAVAAETVAQCSEIIFTPVTTTLLSEDPELVSAFAFCPITSTSWPTCRFKSTVLLVTLKV